MNHPIGHPALGIDGDPDRPVRAARAVPYLGFLRVLWFGLRPHPRLRMAPNGVPTHETNPWWSRVLLDGRRPYSRLRTTPTHRPSALAFETPGAAKNCSAVGSVNPVVSIRERAREIRRDFLRAAPCGHYQRNFPPPPLTRVQVTPRTRGGFCRGYSLFPIGAVVISIACPERNHTVPGYGLGVEANLDAAGGCWG